MAGHCVFKFGGSSVRDTQAFKRCFELLQTQRFSPCGIVVVSATYNTTNRLESLFDLLIGKQGPEAYTFFSKLKDDHSQILNELLSHADENLKNEAQEKLNSIFLSFDQLVQSFLENIDSRCLALDALYAFGELVSSTLFCYGLRATYPEKKIFWLDVRKVMVTDQTHQNAKPDLERIEELAQLNLVPHIKNGALFITQGYIAQTKEGVATTLGREGSDYSATILARATGAKEVVIWTDVPGVASFDPKKAQDCRWLKFLNYEEARALASGGAKVLFPRTLDPVERVQIPVWVCSSYHQEDVGTMIWTQGLKDWALALKQDQLTVVGNDLVLEKINKFLSPTTQMKKTSSGAIFILNQECALELTLSLHAALVKMES